MHRNRTSILLGVFFREVLAVSVFLTLEWRTVYVDLFTPSFTYLLVLVALRLQYINAYIFLLEMFGMAKWELTHHMGVHGDSLHNLLRIVVVLAAHIGAAVGAAAARVYLDVTYGQEFMSLGSGFSPGLSVDLDVLREVDSFWGGGTRLDRIMNNTKLQSQWPLGPTNYLGIGQVPLLAWYTFEDAAYVCLAGVCAIHVWLYAGLGEGKKTPNPFSREYWSHYFLICLMLSVVSAALYRAFPTAHGGLHITIFRWQYQTWNPTVRLVDNENYEVIARIVGGVLGLGLAILYNSLLSSTERLHGGDASGSFWFRFIWGFDPDHAHTRSKRVGRKERPSKPVDYGEEEAETPRKQIMPPPGCFVFRLPDGLGR